MRAIFNDAYAIFFLIFFIKAFVVGTHLNCLDLCCGYSFELPRQVEAIQTSIHNIYFYKYKDTSAKAIIGILIVLL